MSDPTIPTMLAKKVTPTQAFRSVMAPYRDKLERSDAARGKLEGRLRRAFDLFDEEMKTVWGADGVQAVEPPEPVQAGSAG
jgi:hypothetical protein